MTLTSPYASTASPDAAWWDNMTTFLDRAAAAGFRVNFQLIGFEQKGNDAGTLANLTAQIKRFKDHPAIMAWCVLVLPWRRECKEERPSAVGFNSRGEDGDAKTATHSNCTAEAKSFVCRV
jgi:hypothetical protein